MNDHIWFGLDNNQDEISRAIFTSFHSSSVQTKDAMSTKKWLDAT